MATRTIPEGAGGAVSHTVRAVTQHVPRPGKVLRWLFFGIEIVAALLLFLTQATQLEGAFALLALLLILDVIADLNPIQIYGKSYVSVGMVFTIALIVHFGVPGVILAAPLEAGAVAISRRKFDFRAIHNAAMFVLVYSAAGAVYEQFGTRAPSELDLMLIPAVVMATAIAYGMTVTLLAIVHKLVAGEPLGESFRRHLWLAPHYLALGLIGLALAMSFVSLGYFGIIAFLTPAATLRIAIKQYVDKTKDHVVQLEDQNAQLKKANIEVRRMSEELQESYDGTLEALVNALDARDQETKGHSMRVSKYMMDIAREMGVEQGSFQWLAMQRGSLLHDVGKIGVSDSILLKPGKLTDEEWRLMRLHPEIGYNMLRQVKFLEGPAEIILAHHERWDGKGYPRGLAEDEIPLGARIFPVVDTFDAMTSDRPYRAAMSTQEAMNEILKYSGTQFDPRVVEAFLDIYDQWVRMWAELHEEDESIIWMPKAA